MSLDLKVILSKVAVEDNERKEIEFDAGVNRYKSNEDIAGENVNGEFNP